MLLWIIALARAQDDPFAALDGVVNAPPPAGATPAACDDIAAAAAAQNFHIFVGALVLVAALLAVALWWGLERKAFASWGVRWLLATLAASALAFGVLYANPFASDTQLALMADPACQHHFWMAAMGPTGQGLVLGFLPTLFASLLLLLLARRVL